MDPQRQRKLWYVAGGIVIAGFLVFGASAFKQSLTPYVQTCEEARQSTGKVQVMGALVPDSSQLVAGSNAMRFSLEDEQGDTLPVLFTGVKPANFEEATKLVVIGSYHDGEFHADKLLTKCASKYQESSHPDSIPRSS